MPGIMYVVRSVPALGGTITDHWKVADLREAYRLAKGVAKHLGPYNRVWIDKENGNPKEVVRVEWKP